MSNLTKEQLELLKNKIEELENDIASLERNAEENYTIRLAKTKELKELNKMILEAVTLAVNTEEVIGLGSRFSASIYYLDEGAETEDYLISDVNIRVPGFMVITPNTPFGKAVMGKKEKEEFNYTVNGTNIHGKIEEIYKEKSQEAPKVAIKK